MYQHSHLRQAFVGVALVLLAAAPAPTTWAAGAGERGPESTIGELLLTAKNRTLFELERTSAIKALSLQSDPQGVRDQRVVEDLIQIALTSSEPMFVRLPAIQAVGNLQKRIFKTDGYAKNKYLEGFTKLLQDTKEVPFIRAEICKVFAETLELKGIRDEQAFSAMVQIMDDPNKNNPILGQPLTVRIEAANAVGAFGSAKAFKNLSNVLLDPDTDPLLRERVIVAFYNVLSQVEDVKDQIGVPTINKMIEMIRNPKMGFEIRAEVMKALARLYSGGVRGLDEAMGAIRKIIEKEGEMELVVAAVQALGIAGDETSLPILKDAFGDFYNSEDPKALKDLKIRTAIMQTMGYLLSAQAGKKGGPSENAVRDMVELLLGATDPNPEAPKTEFTKGTPTSEVLAPALYSLRYLYPSHAPYELHRRKVVQRLIHLMKLKKTDKRDSPELITGSLRELTIEALYYITQQPYGDNVERWDRWFDVKYPGFKVQPKGDK